MNYDCHNINTQEEQLVFSEGFATRTRNKSVVLCLIPWGSPLKCNRFCMVDE